MARYAQEESAGRIRALAEFLMDQLSSQPMCMDIDIIPGCGVRGACAACRMLDRQFVRRVVV